MVIVAGPPLYSQGRGQWSVDLRLRLRGGAPRKQIAALRERKARRIAELDAEYANHLIEREHAQKRISIEDSVLKAIESGGHKTQNEILAQRLKLVADMDAQISKKEALLANNIERSELGVGLPTDDSMGWN